MNIDGHDVRAESIDAATEIEVKLGGVQEGTDKMARGQFEIFVRGRSITISRAKRCSSEKAAGQAAVKEVHDALTAIRKNVIAVIP